MMVFSNCLTMYSEWSGRIAKRIYIGGVDGSPSVGRPQKRWIDTVKDYLKKRFRCQASKLNGV